MNLSIFVAPIRTTRRVARWPKFLDLWSLSRQRARLARLDDAALRDIGIDRSLAEAEARRPVWDPPEHWRN